MLKCLLHLVEYEYAVYIAQWVLSTSHRPIWFDSF